MKEYSFVFMADETYFMPMTIAITSLVKNRSKNSKYKIFIILDGVSESKKKLLLQFLEDGIEIIIINNESVIMNSYCAPIDKGVEHVSRTDMIKFMLPELLVDEDIVLYLDDDLIVQRCIESIFTTEIKDYYLAAALDMGDHYEDGISFFASRINMGIEYYYFNAGVMLLNLKKMREDQITDRLLDYRKNGINYFMSQDAMNMVTKEKRVLISNEYNFMSNILEYCTFEEINDQFFDGKYSTMTELIRNQFIIHMAGANKPWKKYLPWTTDLFLKYYNQSMYKDEALELISPIFELNSQNKELQSDMIWKFYKMNIGKTESVVLYGAGKRGMFLRDKIKDEKYSKCIAWVDKTLCKSKNEIQPPEAIKKLYYDRIVVANASLQISSEIISTLKAYGVDKKKIIVIG